jgi:hypothetical protein
MNVVPALSRVARQRVSKSAVRTMLQPTEQNEKPRMGPGGDGRRPLSGRQPTPSAPRPRPELPAPPVLGVELARDALGERTPDDAADGVGGRER